MSKLALRPTLLKFLKAWFGWSLLGLVLAFLLFISLAFGEKPVAVTCINPCDGPLGERGPLFHANTALIVWSIWCAAGATVLAVIAAIYTVARSMSTQTASNNGKLPAALQHEPASLHNGSRQNDS